LGGALKALASQSSSPAVTALTDIIVKSVFMVFLSILNVFAVKRSWSFPGKIE